MCLNKRAHSGGTYLFDTLILIDCNVRSEYTLIDTTEIIFLLFVYVSRVMRVTIMFTRTLHRRLNYYWRIIHLSLYERAHAHTHTCLLYTSRCV